MKANPSVTVRLLAAEPGINERNVKKNIKMVIADRASDNAAEREKWLLLARMLPIIENNFKLCELGPRSTGNEVAGVTFKNKDGVQTMKDCMASGSFARGEEEKAASAPELGAVPADLIGAFSLIFYTTPQEAVFKADSVNADDNADHTELALCRRRRYERFGKRRGVGDCESRQYPLVAQKRLKDGFLRQRLRSRLPRHYRDDTKQQDTPTGNKGRPLGKQRVGAKMPYRARVS
jgi:hypothetical protein